MLRPHFAAGRVATAAIAALSLLPPPGAADPAGPGGGQDDGGSARVSNALNPAISFNGLLLGSWRRADTGAGLDPASPLAGPPTGIYLEEAELILSATADPYFKADAVIALEDAAVEGEDGYEIDLEEAYVTALALPRGLGLRAGKMYLPFGRHNLLHKHQFPFIQTTLVNARLFGREGLNEPGVEVSWLLPAAWFSELDFVVADGRNDELFADARAKDLMFMAHWKNLWDLSEAATLELGVSGLYGSRAASASTRTFGFDATYKYRPARRGMYRALEIQGEWLRRQRDPLGEPLAEPAADSGGDDGPTGDGTVDGGYVHVRWQAARRLWLQGRYDRVSYGDDGDEDRGSFLAAFVLSEMTAIRFEYATLAPVRGDRDHQILGQLNFNIGPHPAHDY